MTLRAWIASLVVALSLPAAGAALALDPPADLPAAAASADVSGLQLADIAPPPPPKPEPGKPTAIDGRWRVGKSIVVELKDGQFQLFFDGTPDEAGTFTLDGDRITTRTASGTESSGRITREGDLILIEPEDDEPLMLMHAEPPSGAAPAPGSVEGRWRTALGDYVELTGGQALYREAPSQEPGVGSYRIEGDQLVIVAPGGDETRGPWVRFGERLIIETDDGPLFILSPEGGASTASTAETQVADVVPPEETTVATDGTAASAPTAIDGRWRIGPDLVIEFAGGQYQVHEAGEAAEKGTYRLDGDRIAIREASDTEEHAGRVTRAGDAMLLEPDDESPMLLRAETASGAAPAANPADLLGRWRTNEGDVVEVQPGGHFLMHTDDGPEDIGYRIEGDVLIVEEGPGGGESRMRWVTLGDRVVLEMEGDDEVIILTPEPGEATQVPEPDPATPLEIEPAPEPSQTSQAIGDLAAADEVPAPDQPAPDQPAADQPAAAAASASVVDGRWVMGPGLVIELADGHYEVSENGQVQVTGGFTIEGDTLLLHRDTDAAGEIRRSRFTRAGDALLVEPEEDDPVLLFAETPGGAAATPAPEDIEGRWRSSQGDVVELRGGHFVFFAEDGSIAREGSYTVAGDTVTLQSPDRTETGRWVRLGERVALQMNDANEAVVLTPEPMADTGQLPQAPADGDTTGAASTPGQSPAPEPVEQPVAQTTGQTEPPPAEPTEQLPTPAQPADSPQPPPPPEQPQPPAAQAEAPPPVAPVGQAEPVQPPPAPPPLPPAQLSAQLSDGTPLGEQWAGYLKGKRMAQGVGQPVLQILDLCSDGQYFWLVGQGTQTPQVQGTGAWSVPTQGPVASLQLTPAGAPPGLLQLDFDGQTTYLNRIPTQVIAMNQSCP